MTLKQMTTDWGIDELRPTITEWITDTHKAVPSQYKNFVKDQNTDQFFIEMGRMGGFGDFSRLDEGDVMKFGMPDLGDKVRIQPERRQMAFAITYQDKKFNKINKLEETSRMLMQAAKRSIEKIALMPLNLAFDSGYPGADGQPLLSQTHTRLNGEITSNTPSAQVDLTQASLEAAVISFGATKGEDGTIIGNVPKYLVVGNANRFNASRILNAVSYYPSTGSGSNLPNAADTGVPNVLKGLGLVLIVADYLADPDAWFLLSDKDFSKYRMVWNEQITPRMFDDNYTEDHVYSLAFSCFAAIATDLGIYGSSGS